MKYLKPEKISLAERIVKKQKKNLFKIITSNPANTGFANERDFLYFIEEDAKYKIKRLKLPKKLEKHYLNKITEIYGEYSEDQPSKKERYYDNEFYVNKNQ